jgi:hypothetical protein
MPGEIVWLDFLKIKRHKIKTETRSFVGQKEHNRVQNTVTTKMCIGSRGMEELLF